MQTSIRMLLIFIVLTGLIYPMLMTGIGQLLFRDQVNGSLIVENDKTRGSILIGQNFSSARYFWSRPSAIGYNAECSGATNFSPTHPDLKRAVLARRESFRKAHNIVDEKTIPAEMILCSGSGLDPHISPQAAYLQVERIANARNLSEQKKQQLLRLIRSHTITPTWGFLGENRVNVLQLNLALDHLCR